MTSTELFPSAATKGALLLHPRSNDRTALRPLRAPQFAGVARTVAHERAAGQEQRMLPSRAAGGEISDPAGEPLSLVQTLTSCLCKPQCHAGRASSQVKT